MGTKILAFKTAIIKKMVEFWHTFKSGTWLKSPVFWARFMAYFLPLCLFIWVLWWNYSPLGYNKTYTIDVGSENDTKGRFYLEPSKDLGERQTAEDGITFRTLNGVVYAVFKPEAVLRDARLIFEIKGGDAFMMPLTISDDYSKYKWEYNWDFAKGSLPEGLKGNANFTTGEACASFNGIDQKLELPESKDLFENEAFTVYAKWRPDNSASSSQQIVGHYNWGLWQNKDNVEFRVGRMNNKDGKFYSIKAPILEENPEDFFGQTHTALAIYNPDSNGGYIDLYMDEQYAGRTYFGGERIWEDYNGNRNLSIGKSDHGTANYFDGCIYETNINNGLEIKENKKVSFRVSGFEDVKIPVVSNSIINLENIIIYVKNH